MPFEVADYVDFYSSIHHATNLGRLFRPDAEPLLPNWRHLPVGYHGRAGTVVERHAGRAPARPDRRRRRRAAPRPDPAARHRARARLRRRAAEPARRAGAIERAPDHIFGLVLVNDWSARDIQAWEYQPLGPFLGKSFATSIRRGSSRSPRGAPSPRRRRTPSRSPTCARSRGRSTSRSRSSSTAHVVSGRTRATSTGRRPAARPPDRERRTCGGRPFASGTISGPEPERAAA